MGFQNEIYGLKFSSPPKNYEVLRLLTKFLKEKKGVADIQHLEDKHAQIIEHALQGWNLIDATEFRKIYAQEKNRVDRNIAEMRDIAENGWGIKQYFEVALLVFILLCICFSVYKYFDGKEERDLKKQIRNEFYAEVAKSTTKVQNILKDPDSAEFKEQIYNCGLVNAKNSFGAYTGFKKYIVIGDQVFLEDTNVDSDSINQNWDKLCKK